MIRMTFNPRYLQGAGCAVLILSMTSCGGSGRGDTTGTPAAPIANAGPSPLEQLAPGQRLPYDYFLSADAAYALIRLEQNDDAKNGTMTITFDGADESSCIELTDNLAPWKDICVEAAESNAPVVLSGDAITLRMTITMGDRAEIAGAHATVDRTGSSADYPVSLIDGDYDTWRLGVRPSEEIAISERLPALLFPHSGETLNGLDEIKSRIDAARAD